MIIHLPPLPSPSLASPLRFAYPKETSTIHVGTSLHTNLPKLLAFVILSFCYWKKTTSTLGVILWMYYHTLKVSFLRLSPQTLYDRCVASWLMVWNVKILSSGPFMVCIPWCTVESPCIK